MDVFALLMDDHRTVEQLFSQYEQSQSNDIALQICNELTVHALVEEELVYPLMAAKVDQEKTLEARHEHQEAKQLVSQIEAGLVDGSDVSSLVQQLKESVQHHVQEEESELFPTMQNKLPELVEHMGEEVANRKVQLQAKMDEARSLGQTSSVVDDKTTNV